MTPRQIQVAANAGQEPPPWHPWDDAESCIAALRDMRRQAQEEVRTLRERLSRQWREGYDAGVRAAKAGTP